MSTVLVNFVFELYFIIHPLMISQLFNLCTPGFYTRIKLWVLFPSSKFWLICFANMRQNSTICIKHSHGTEKMIMTLSVSLIEHKSRFSLTGFLSVIMQEFGSQWDQKSSKNERQITTGAHLETIQPRKEEDINSNPWRRCAKQSGRSCLVVCTQSKIQTHKQTNKHTLGETKTWGKDILACNLTHEQGALPSSMWHSTERLQRGPGAAV